MKCPKCETQEEMTQFISAWVCDSCGNVIYPGTEATWATWAERAAAEDIGHE